MFGSQPNPRTPRAMAASAATHAVLLALAVFIANRQPPPTARSATPVSLDHLVFLDLPGASGGGGGGGEVTITPASVVRAVGDAAISTPAPVATSPLDPTPPPPQPMPSATLPLVPMGADVVPRVGAVTSLFGRPSRGPGTGPGADGGRGPGSGGGDGRGVGEGEDDGTGGGVFQLGAGIESPVRLREVKPSYTSGAMQAKIQGVVWVEATVLPSGQVVNPKVVRSLDRLYGLDEQAIQAVLATPFRPGTKDGKPVAVRVTFELTFALR